MLCLKAPTEGALCKKGSKLFHFIIVKEKMSLKSSCFLVNKGSLEYFSRNNDFEHL